MSDAQISTEDDPLSAFKSMRKMLKGDDGKRGALGFSGHNPMHVSATEPTKDVLLGDLWLQP